MADKPDEHDPKGLIREAYRIDPITEAECRSIFMDWALTVPGADARAHLPALVDRYAEARPDHPMTAVLREGLDAPARSGRRGGRAGRKPPAPD